MKKTKNTPALDINFFTLLKNIFSDIYLVLKNFFHWTGARIIVITSCFLIAAVSFVPFFFILVILGLLDSIEWGELLLAFISGTSSPLFVTAFFTSPMMMIFEGLIMLLGVAFALGVYNYKKVLLYRLADSYFKKEKMPLKEVFTMSFFRHYLKVFPVLFGVFLIPILVFLIYFFLIIFIFGGFASVYEIVESSVINTVSILLVVGFALSILVAIYLYYKLVFSYAFLLEEDQKGSSGKTIVQISYNSIVGLKLIQLFSVVVLYVIITAPFGIYSDYAEEKTKQIKEHLYYRNIIDYPEVSEGLLAKTEFATVEDLENSINYVALESQFGKISEDDLRGTSSNLQIIYRLIALMSFFLLYGMFELVIMSFYRRKIRPYDESAKKENKVRKLVHAILHPLEKKESKTAEEL